MKKFLLLSILLLPIAVFADPLTYKVEGEIVTVVDCDEGASGELVIPSIYDGKAVTTIGHSAFVGCISLTSVTIPDSVTSIGDHAFYGCSSLTSVMISDSVTTIGDYAFYGCSSLASVTIPDSVTSIVDGTFEGCSNLTSVTIPDSVTSIGHRAFAGCSSLTKITFEGNAPRLYKNRIIGASESAKVFINPDATGFGETFGGLPVVIVVTPPAITLQPKAIEAIIGGAATFTVAANGEGHLRYQWFKNGEVIHEATKTSYSISNIKKSDFTSYTVAVENNAGKVVSKVADLINPNYPLTYKIVGNTVSITDCETFASGELVIPSSYEGRPVTRIEDYALRGCNSLTSVTIPDRVASIGAYAFFGCSSLASVSIPYSVTKIGEYAFAGCSSMTSIEVSKDNAQYSSENGVLFDKTKTTLIQFPAGKSGHYTIPENVTSIESGAFFGSSSLTSVATPESVTSIGDGAFEGCSGLTKIAFEGNAPELGIGVFVNVPEEAKKFIKPGATGYGKTFGGLPVVIEATPPVITLQPKAIEAIIGGTATFTVEANGEGPLNYQWHKNGEAILEATKTSYSINNINESDYASYTVAVENKVGKVISKVADLINLNDPLTYKVDGSTVSITDCETFASGELVIPSNYEGKPITSIGGYAFYNCGSLTGVMIPDSVTSIGARAFAGCSSLTSMMIPNSVTSIGAGVFRDCSSLTSIKVDKNHTQFSSEKGVLFNKNKTELIQFPAGKSGHYVIPNSVTNIGSESFLDCSNLMSVTIPHSVIGLEYYTFRGCTSLTSIEVDKGNTKYSSENGVLFNKDKTTLIQFPAGKSGHYTIPDSVTSIGNITFRRCISLTSVTIPESATSIGELAFSGCSSLTSMTIPRSVTSVGAEAFEGCSVLTNISFEGNAPVLDIGVFANVSDDAKIFIKPGATGYGETFGGLPVVIEATPPEINIQPKTIEAIIGSNVTFIVEANGKGPFKYQWYKNGEVLLKATKKSYYIDNIKESDFASYTVSVGNNAGKVISKVADLINLNDPLTYKIVGNTVAITDCETFATGELVIPSSYEGKPITSIGAAAFIDCSSLTSVTIPDSITSIGDEAFAGCSSLTSVTIGKSITRIEDRAFWNCGNLTNITFNGNAPELAEMAFDNVSNNAKVYVKLGASDFSKTFGGLPVKNINNFEINYFNNSNNQFEVRFETEKFSIYTIEVTQDFKKWDEIGEVKGTGSNVRFVDPRLPTVPFQSNYFRVKKVK